MIRGLLGNQVREVLKGLTLEANLARKVTQDAKAFLAKEVFKAPRGFPDILVRGELEVHEACQVWMAKAAHRVHQACKASTDQVVGVDQKARGVRKDYVDQWEKMDLLVRKDPMGKKDLQALKVLVANQVASESLATKECQAPAVNQAMQVQGAYGVLPAQMASQVRSASLVSRGVQGQWARQAMQVCQVSQASQASQGFQGPPALPVHQGRKVFQDFKDHLACKAIEAKTVLVSSGRAVCQDPVDLVVLLAWRARQALRATAD